MVRSVVTHSLSGFAEIVRTGRIDGKPILLNRAQCKFVAHICIRLLKQIDVSSLPACLLKEISATLKELFGFFERCTENLWLSSLATHLGPHDAHLLHLKNFMVCMAASLAFAEHLSTRSPFIDCFVQSASSCEKHVGYSELEDHTRTDLNDMRRLLSEKSKVSPSAQRKQTCFSRYFSSKKLVLSQESRLAAFLARKCDEVVGLSSTPTDAPKAYCIPSEDLAAHICCSLGEEGTSKVYEQKWLGQTVAVKEFDTEDGAFVKETCILAGLSNPYIVKLIGWSRNEVKGTYSLVMERMQEGLHDFMSCNTISLPVAVDIMLQISRGMEYLHSKNVIHRDLKPPNVLVNPCRHNPGYLRVKLADFGIAKFQPETMLFSTERQGTWYYRAPEVLQYADFVNGEGFNVVFKKYTLKADVFSFAIVCYEILAERAPDCFVNCHPREFYNRVISNVRSELPDACPQLLAECIKRCWHSKPSKRPSFAELSKVLVYMKSSLLAFDSPTVACLSANITHFVHEEGNEGLHPADGPKLPSRD